ncbi:MAG: hypothetical protein ABIE43_01915 [Patescibacteria group bacterium]
MGEKITKKDIEIIVGKAIENFAHIVNNGFTEQAKFFDNKIEGVKTDLNEKIEGVKTSLENSERNILNSNDKIAKGIKDMR